MAYLLVLLLFAFTPLKAEPSYNQGMGMTLSEAPKTYTELFGFQFGNSVTASLKQAKELGLTILSSKVIDQKKNIRELFLVGSIDELKVSKGKWRLLYEDNSLVSLDISFPPTYRNFLMIRGQLLQSLGDRFKIKNRQEAMESGLKQRLTFGSKEERVQIVKQDLIASIKQGKTFYHYQIEDQFGEVNIYYTFKRSFDKTQMEPDLNLRYTLAAFEEEALRRSRPEIPNIAPR